MRVAVVYAPSDNGEALASLAQAMTRGLLAKGWMVDMNEAKPGEVNRLTGYDYVIIGTEGSGLGGKIPKRVNDFLAQAGSLQGKRSMAFVRKRGLFSAKALRRLMSAMEAEGMIVNDASVVAGPDEALEVARDAPIERN